MTLENVVAERLKGYVSIEQIITEISSHYKCSLSEARYVLAEALKKSVSMPSLYERGRLGPEEINSFEAEEILKALGKPERDPEEELYFAIPF
ncbi:hypothetical protein SAMN05421509_10163 [Chromohalobacter canadensis]|uniref:Uncharacterized protein n=1 Tax=Chromohalobacter canadensis TaxID=141389 RepID=A0A285VD65_9GAMM|nr:hypothetical protein [Chromohalobacter canadensis]SOC51006.1 hypothetical protein SAMN05421509_10163 [Chromohalobacter canadensis]